MVQKTGKEGAVMQPPSANMLPPLPHLTGPAKKEPSLLPAWGLSLYIAILIASFFTLYISSTITNTARANMVFFAGIFGVLFSGLFTSAHIYMHALKKQKKTLGE